jgi:hypothetical protein
MKYTQMLTHEIGTDCNMADVHAKKCPISIVNRPGTNPMPDEVIAVNISKAYKMGFAGMCSWYYYCEPSLYLDRIEKIIDMTKDVPGIKHLLWTNGTLLEKQKNKLSMFSKIVVSNYQKTSWRWVKKYVPDVMVVSGVLDDRKTNGRETQRRCLRPYHEIIFDYFGNLHLCCGDHQKSIFGLNVMRDGFENCVKAYQRMRYLVSKKGETLPPVCAYCRVRGRESIDEIVTKPCMRARRKNEP